jgi:hypothetical protein
VHDLYVEPKYEEFRSRTIWSLSNTFTSARPDTLILLRKRSAEMTVRAHNFLLYGFRSLFPSTHTFCPESRLVRVCLCTHPKGLSAMW